MMRRRPPRSGWMRAALVAGAVGILLALCLPTCVLIALLATMLICACILRC